MTVAFPSLPQTPGELKHLGRAKGSDTESFFVGVTKY